MLVVIAILLALLCWLAYVGYKAHLEVKYYQDLIDMLEGAE